MIHLAGRAAFAQGALVIPGVVGTQVFLRDHRMGVQGSRMVTDARTGFHCWCNRQPLVVNLVGDRFAVLVTDALAPRFIQQVIAHYCRGPHCVLAFDAVARMRARGLMARRLEDGFPEWKTAGLPIETGIPD